MKESRVIKNLKSVTSQDRLLVGGKAYNLTRLLKSGFNVPDGFVITTSSCKSSERNISRNIERAIYKAFDGLDSQFVAVRSSATSEDSSKLSWAGQLSTFLFTERDTLLSNIQKCWDSINSSRAKIYRKRNNINTSSFSVAVIVQKMVNAEVSGVAFTTHPVLKNKDLLLIEAVYGLGEAIVSGSVTPDSYIISKADLSIRDIQTKNQNKMVSKAISGMKWISVPKSKQAVKKLSNKKIIELVRLCLEIEKYYSKPQDIEWCLKDEKFYILQSRPITTL